jgi:hypothetical protein
MAHALLPPNQHWVSGIHASTHALLPPCSALVMHARTLLHPCCSALVSWLAYTHAHSFLRTNIDSVTAGQGTNQALEDAVSLGRHLGSRGVSPEALREYEASRMERVRLVALQSSVQGGGAYHLKKTPGMEKIGSEEYPQLKDFQATMFGITFEPLEPASKT